MKKILAILLIIAMMTAFTACGGGGMSENIMDGVTVDEKYAPGSVDAADGVKATDFGVRLFKANFSSENNTLISPFSVLAALAMTSNGAEGETKAQMEEVLGMSVNELNEYIPAYVNGLENSESSRLLPANSIWFTADDRFTVNEGFLESNALYYNADIYRAPFDDTTLKDINNWVKNKTDGMIPEILDKIPEEAVMYLVNALAFEADWWEVYNKDQVWPAEFTKEDGTKEKIDLMYSQEWNYLNADNASGFIKYYKDGKYAFAALLPEEGLKMEDFIESLDGSELHEILSNPEETTVEAAIPKFETEFDTEMSEVLKSMGMTLAFDPKNADFTGLGESTDGNISISRVLHKTFISVAEQGTKAGAATVVEMVDEGAAFLEDGKRVTLDRPFLYMLIDCETNTPFFIGTMMHVNEE